MRKWWAEWIDRPYQPGMIIRQYQLIHILGMGSYGITYLALDKKTNTYCALKQVRPSKRKGNKGYPIFKREAEILSMVDYPAFPKLLEQFQYKNQLFLAMEYIDGPSMEERVFDLGEKFSEHEALAFILQLLQLVQILHGKGLVHRDIRLPNVIFNKDQLYLLDFGLAQFIGEAPTAMARDLDDYSVEKQLRREVAYKSDFYAMGHFLLFLLYTTFEGTGDKSTSWEEELEISPGTRMLLRKMLQLDPPYLEAFALEEEIKRIMEGLK